MNVLKGMTKYYVGLALLVVFAAGLVGYTIVSGADAKSDKKTTEAVMKIAPKLDEFVNTKGSIPDKLSEIDGVGSVPTTITYKKLSEEKYKFCVVYKTEASGFDAGVTGIFTGALYGSALSGADYPASESYFDYYSLTYNHKKGENCQTVKPYLNTYKDDQTYYDSSSTDYGGSAVPAGTASVCVPSSTGYTAEGSGVIEVIDIPTKTISLAQNVTGKPAQIEFDDITKAYDKSCAEIKVGALKVGDSIKHYGFVATPLVDVIELQ